VGYPSGVGQFFNRDRLFALQIGGNNPPFVRTSQSQRPLPGQPDSSVGSGSAFGTGFGGASVGGETFPTCPIAAVEPDCSA